MTTTTTVATPVSSIRASSPKIATATSTETALSGNRDELVTSEGSPEVMTADMDIGLDAAVDYSADAEADAEGATVPMEEALSAEQNVSQGTIADQTVDMEVVTDAMTVTNDQTSNADHAAALPSAISKTAVAVPALNIDRSKICPFLIRVFINVDGVHDDIDFAKGRLPQKTVALHCWKDTTMREIASLLGESIPAVTEASAKLIFRTVNRTEHTRGVFKPRTIGSVFNFKRTTDEGRTLDDIRFIPGDFLDVSVSTSIFSSGGVLHSKMGGGMRSDRHEVVRERHTIDLGTWSSRVEKDRSAARFTPYPSSRKEPAGRGGNRGMTRGQRRPSDRGTTW
ncbi:hypothetical protein BASA50_003598 [Batrachochytrium salamandrivorans]|uniref:Histone deacetylase complex subunit SAP18 n=1 Tax=Batrachochytrium salamandrivorans TaxID=1357716 RepID=A0ABQ8FHY8_9FUNG|nr:hypothetical protein BASA62_009929 [Batrachochytrium salamandrivorans]KAH6569856.1 hypothetical protein BASA60_008052 [Batrachochytrium salamandrivorans]KAH6598560.1 hypothetical protein BASA50_003598 [Batrachochytrium salamandrivorans]KAH6600738.1 hypothetical protein BASA61_002155 [Batrachochytrium salamandrivorans]KAH9246670.1 hypothetical protein BASA81_015765 [Batrachochytrium salamandrivorans]